MRSTRTSVEIPEDLYAAFKAIGGSLSHVVREAIREYIGVKGASEDSLALLELKMRRHTEDKISADKRVSELENIIMTVQQQIDVIKGKIQEKDNINAQASIMKQEVNPYIRRMDYEVPSMTPELHEMLLLLRSAGLEHTLESIQKHAKILESSDYYLDIKSRR